MNLPTAPAATKKRKRWPWVLLVVIAVFAWMPPAHAVNGVWDANDVRGRFDLRWVGASYTSSGEIHLSVSFYDGFDWRLLPRKDGRFGKPEESHVGVDLSAALTGIFFRRLDGQLAFVWGDSASACCGHAIATRPSSNVISVTFDPCSYVYGEEIEMAQGYSLWRTRNVRAVDRTGQVGLAHPDCGFE